MSPRVYCTNFNADVDVETLMPTLVRTHSSSSTDSSAPSTPVTESGNAFEFYERAANSKAIQVEIPISSQTGRRCVAYHPIALVKTDHHHHSAIHILFLLAMLLVDVLRVLSWVPICLWIIMGEVWVVAMHELQIDVKAAAVNGGIVAVVATIVGFLLL